MARNQHSISQPIVVQITSGSNSSDDVTFFDALKYQNVRPNVIISDPGYGLPLGFSVNVPFFTFGQLLHSLISNSYQIGLLIITVLSGASNIMLLNPLGITAYNMQGDGATKTERIVRNTFQNITSQVIHKVDFLLGADTTIKIGGTFKKNTTVEYAFYPTKNYESSDVENYGKEYELPDFESVREIGNKQTNKFLIN
ncbi:MAG: hypothetical protein Q8L90_06930, partial [Bacteroidota bacterium]|nr:hypothetical protein [Bacteroidota bacterium]